MQTKMHLNKAKDNENYNKESFRCREDQEKPEFPDIFLVAAIVAKRVFLVLVLTKVGQEKRVRKMLVTDCFLFCVFKKNRLQLALIVRLLSLICFKE